MPFFIPGVLAFFVLLGFFGLILHCSAFNSNDPRMAGCQNCCYGWGILDCFPASMEACFALVIVFVVIFAILGIAYGFLAATMAIQRIWQRHYHILTKRELTKVSNSLLSFAVSAYLYSLFNDALECGDDFALVFHELTRMLIILKLLILGRQIISNFNMLQEYIVEDLHGCYTPPKLDAEHEERLKMLKLL